MTHQVQTIDGSPHDYTVTTLNDNVAVVESAAGIGFFSPFLLIDGKRFAKLVGDNKKANFLRKDQ
jgi:hypothetical protein